MPRFDLLVRFLVIRSSSQSTSASCSAAVQGLKIVTVLKIRFPLASSPSGLHPTRSSWRHAHPTTQAPLTSHPFGIQILWIGMHTEWAGQLLEGVRSSFVIFVSFEWYRCWPIYRRPFWYPLFLCFHTAGNSPAVRCIQPVTYPSPGITRIQVISDRCKAESVQKFENSKYHQPEFEFFICHLYMLSFPFYPTATLGCTPITPSSKLVCHQPFIIMAFVLILFQVYEVREPDNLTEALNLAVESRQSPSALSCEAIIYDHSYLRSYHLRVDCFW
jgi:hypothetical protein